MSGQLNRYMRARTVQPLVETQTSIHCEKVSSESTGGRHAHMRLLLVGEGDCSYSLALARAFGTAVHITCTTFISEEECVATYARAQAVIAELRELGHSVCDGVDATALASCAPPLEPPYDHVCFLHPHLGLDDILDEAAHARRHSILVAHFLASAAEVLVPDGCIHLTLCQNQPRTWEVHAHAARLNLRVLHEKDTVSPSCFFPADGPATPPAILPVSTAWGARRKFRSGALGSRHWAGKYGYEHRRCEGDEDMNVDNSIELVFCVPSSCLRPSASVVQQQSATVDAAETTMKAAASVTPLEGCGCCPICGVNLVDANGDADEDAAAHVRRLAKPSCTAAGEALRHAAAQRASAGGASDVIVPQAGQWRCEATGRVFRSEAQYRTYLKQQQHNPGKPRKTAEAAASAATAAAAASRVAAAAAAAALAVPGVGSAPAAATGSADPALGSAAASTAASCSSRLQRIRHTVTLDGEGERAAKWAKNVAFTSKLRSKKQSHQAFKEGRVLLGGCPVEETRCLRAGDVLELLHDPLAAVRSQAAGSANAPVVLLRVEEQIAFVIKPAGKTAVGDYVGTLQSALRVLLPPTTPPTVRSEAGPLVSPMPVTRLEASTTGVTLIARSRRALDELEALASRSEITHCFLALVYGQVPAAWSSEPSRLELPAKVQCKKGYKRKQLIAAARALALGPDGHEDELVGEDGGDGEEEEGEEEEEEGEEEEGEDGHKEEASGEANSRRVGRAGGAAGNDEGGVSRTTIGANMLGAEVVLATCLDRTPPDCAVQLSTVRLECGGRRGRLSGDLCFLMRRLGHPVVGDRYARRERGTLPRYFSVLKGKTQLTCVGVHATAPAVAFEVPVPLRLLASSWASLEAAAQARAAEREGAPTSSSTYQ